jgi:pyruvate-formate lyase-activating enzyme
MLTLAAQALRAGHPVWALNLSNFPWPAVELLVEHMPADLFGLSCLTANRRGVAMTARLIKQFHPGSLIVAGGPHVSAMPLDILQHYPEIDLVAIGEAEETWMEIIRCLDLKIPVDGIAGTAWRDAGGPRLGPPRPILSDLDRLAAPVDYFKLRTILTSRGCPMRCTFCGSRMMWGQRVRYHSVDYVLDMLEKAVKRDNQQFIAIKDDSFTADKRRVLKICDGIRHRGLDFVWSCDTRADFLTEELLLAMRRAGCRRISLGLESASEEILKNIRKQISPETVLAATRLARKTGIQIRYYLMVGNRGESLQTFQRTLEFIEAARPNQIVFSQLHLYPGTQEFDIFQQLGLVSKEMFFSGDFFCLTCFAGKVEDEPQIRSRLLEMEGLQRFRDYSLDEYRSVVARLPDLPGAHVDMCRAYLRENRPDAAERHLKQAVALGYFLPGIVEHLRACIAAARCDYKAVGVHLERSLKIYPHAAANQSYRCWRSWLEAGGIDSGIALEMAPGGGFETTVLWSQPEYPDPFSLRLDSPVSGTPRAVFAE